MRLKGKRMTRRGRERQALKRSQLRRARKEAERARRRTGGAQGSPAGEGQAKETRH
jgi:hypothetical protein